MSERIERLEAELVGMQPRPISADLLSGIESRFAAGEARPWADRFLLTSIGAGALAACVIVTVLMSEPRGSDPGAASTRSPSSLRAGDYPIAFARADGTWFDPFK
jgi:hypothetical protein